jgi:hypothetical protein
VERVWAEWDKWATKASSPRAGLQVLEETGWLRHFPEVAALRGTQQEPEWHPEGDVFTHTQPLPRRPGGLDGWRVPGRHAAGCSPLPSSPTISGSPATTLRAERRGALRWVSPGHEAAGGPLCRRVPAEDRRPARTRPPVRALVVHHLAHHHGCNGDFSDSQVRRLARKLAPADDRRPGAVMVADAMGRPPLPYDRHPGCVDLPPARRTPRRWRSRPAAPRPIIQGRHLLALGRKPGPDFKPVLDAAFEAQLDGAFTDEAGGLAWLTAKAMPPAPMIRCAPSSGTWPGRSSAWTGSWPSCPATPTGATRSSTCTWRTPSVPEPPSVARPDAYTRGSSSGWSARRPRAGIGVVPIVNLLGHTQYLIKVPALRELNELRGPTARRSAQGQVCPLHPSTLEVADALLGTFPPSAPPARSTWASTSPSAWAATRSRRGGDRDIGSRGALRPLRPAPERRRQQPGTAARDVGRHAGAPSRAIRHLPPGDHRLRLVLLSLCPEKAPDGGSAISRTYDLAPALRRPTGSSTGDAR